MVTVPRPSRAVGYISDIIRANNDMAIRAGVCYIKLNKLNPLNNLNPMIVACQDMWCRVFESYLSGKSEGKSVGQAANDESYIKHTSVHPLYAVK